jgi:hypothetical protein
LAIRPGGHRLLLEAPALLALCLLELPEGQVPVTPEQMYVIAGFASGLGALKAKAELGEGCQLTPQEVKGIIWGIKQLRIGQRDENGKRDG